jgi:glycosyltransferase involved in cell wall biosynthesis
MPDIAVIIPAYNEEKAIGKVIREIPKDIVNEIVVVNNNSNDNTVKVALSEGANVIDEPKQGYGQACLKGIDYLKNKSPQPDIVVFIDGDHSDYPSELSTLVRPIIENGMDMVIGSRTLGKAEKGALMPQQIFGNRLATTLIKLIYGIKYTDLGPFRAIKFNALIDLNMQDTNYGWTAEMQIKAAKQKLNISEIPVSYRKRTGTSKISGTIKGSLSAGYKIIKTIYRCS